jgi:hypothetical protein
MPDSNKKRNGALPGEWGRKSEYKPDYCQQIVDYMSQGYSVGSFGAHIGVTKTTIYEWFNVHPEFEEAHELGKQMAMKFFETMLMSSMTGTIPKQLADKGSKKIDITAVIFALKTRFHQDYSEKTKLEHSSPDGSMSPKIVVEVVGGRDKDSSV